MSTSRDIVEKTTIMTIYAAPYIAHQPWASQTLSPFRPGKTVDFSASWGHNSEL
jgi:hypothetical protein